jgi:predicted RNase H-like HicB family nuclease
MKYPLYVWHGDAGFRCRFPDFPEADAVGGSLEELVRNAQEMVERIYDGSEQLIPAPTCDTSELKTLEMDDGQGIWMFVDINLSRVTSRAVSFEFSLLDGLLQQVDAAARERNLTRSAFITQSITHELMKRQS